MSSVEKPNYENYADYFIATTSPKLKNLISIKEVLEEEYGERFKII